MTDTATPPAAAPRRGPLAWAGRIVAALAGLALAGLLALLREFLAAQKAARTAEEAA